MSLLSRRVGAFAQDDPRPSNRIGRAKNIFQTYNNNRNRPEISLCEERGGGEGEPRTTRIWEARRKGWSTCGSRERKTRLCRLAVRRQTICLNEIAPPPLSRTRWMGHLRWAIFHRARRKIQFPIRYFVIERIRDAAMRCTGQRTTRLEDSSLYFHLRYANATEKSFFSRNITMEITQAVTRREAHNRTRDWKFVGMGKGEKLLIDIYHILQIWSVNNDYFFHR